MRLPFYKYQATGNDFVLVDNRGGDIALSINAVQKLCDRKFGIGADGLMLIEQQPEADFKLVYFNSDGSQSLCGNGSRAAVKLAAHLGLFAGAATFMAYDGTHRAELLANGDVRLCLNDVAQLVALPEGVFVNTGSPHLIKFVQQVHQHPVVTEGRALRHSETFAPGGTNVNFVEVLADHSLSVRTYERGVEDETLSCGTGVAAAAIASSQQDLTSPVRVHTRGGELSVSFTQLPNGHFTNIYLTGPAQMVFKGEIEISE
jgi:diaminopimelate epimerase